MIENLKVTKETVLRQEDEVDYTLFVVEPDSSLGYEEDLGELVAKVYHHFIWLIDPTIHTDYQFILESKIGIIKEILKIVLEFSKKCGYDFVLQMRRKKLIKVELFNK